MIDLEGKTRTGAWRLEDAGEDMAFLVFDHPEERVNVLSEAVLEDLDAILEALRGDSDLRALIVVGGKEDSGTFIAGANVHEIRDVDDKDEASSKAALGQAVLGRFSTLPAVTIAAIDGACLGGGTELALACDLRIATSSPKTRIGLPEVQLGILPGFGGTQRLPRLVGLSRALPLILTGRPQPAAKAAKIGLVDRVVYPGRLHDEALALAGEALAKGGKTWRPRRPRPPWLVRVVEATPFGRALIRRRARKQILKRMGPHYPAPLRALDAAVYGYGRRLAAGLDLEARLVGELVASPTSKNLIDLFLTSERARRGVRPEDGESSESACAVDGAQIGILGAGVMGGGLAALLARKGFRVRMKDISWEQVQVGLQSVRKAYDGRVKRRRMTKGELTNCLAAISATLDYDGFGTSALVIEAVVENLDVKKDVLREVEKEIPEDAVLASNTSSLSITAMQGALERPDRFVGIHFFNPVDRMLLVEVVRGAKSGDEAVEAGEALARKLGKIPVRVADGPGFLVNRLLAPYLNEAVRLFEEGYSPVAIDRVVRRFGMPMGPFELLDEVGFDVAAKVGRVLFEAFGDRARPAELMGKLTESPDLLGKKTGQGFYLHRRRKKSPNPAALDVGGTAGRGFRSEDADLWIKRLVYPVINEAARALDEKIIERPSLVDLAMVMGTGFAPFRGGPLRYADTVGVRQVAEALENLREDRLAPCGLLARLASEGRGFYSLEPKEEADEKEKDALHSA